MLIKANKSQNQSQRVNSQAGLLIDEKVLEELLDKKLSKLDLVKNKYSQEEIDAKAQDMIEARAKELLENLNQELEIKKVNNQHQLEASLEEARKQAQEILAQAQMQAQLELKNLDKQKHDFEIEKQAMLKDIDQLRYNTIKEAVDEAKPYVNEVVEIFRNLNKDKKDLANYIKDNVATIAFDVAKQILKYEVHTNDNLLEQQVLHSVNKLIDSKGVMKISLNPQDKEKQENLQDLLANILDKSIRLVFLYDDAIDLGSCVIETQGGKLNSSFSTQLATIKASFEQYLGHKISILPDEPFVMEFELEDETQDQELDNIYKDSEMPKSQASKQQINIEPSDQELSELEENFDDFADLDIEDDLAALLGDVLEEDDFDSKKSDFKPDSEEELSLIDVNDATDLGANDFANGEDWADEEDFIEDLSESSDNEYQDEDGNTFVEYSEFDDDENFGDSDDSRDERFPEY